MLEFEAYGEKALADVELGERMIEALSKYYPGHAFIVECNHEAGHLIIQLLYRDNKNLTRKWNYGMLAHISNLKGHDDIKKYAMRFGGELLERYNLAREGINPFTLEKALSNGFNAEGAIH